MVDAQRYLAHHEEEAQRISGILSQFGRSGETDGFWCSKGDYTRFFDCIHCERDNYCNHNHPPLSRRYRPDSKGIDRYVGDMGLDFLMNDRGPEDWVWLQHPETRRR